MADKCPEYQAVPGPYRTSWSVVRVGPRGGKSIVIVYHTKPTFPTSEKLATDLATFLNEHSWRELR